MRRLVALLATARTARAQTPRRVHGFDVRTRAGHAFMDHFVAYDNGSRGDHAWLRAARHYARRGLLTLVDWPYQLGGEGTTGNNVAQRAQLSHAAFAFSPRVAWLGTFDVDEFFVRVGVENHGSI